MLGPGGRLGANRGRLIERVVSACAGSRGAGFGWHPKNAKPTSGRRSFLGNRDIHLLDHISLITAAVPLLRDLRFAVGVGRAAHEHVISRRRRSPAEVESSPGI